MPAVRALCAPCVEPDRLLSHVFGAFTALALLIAAFGLFALAAFTAAQRTKEIGVRKVLGASAFGLVALLSKDFVRLVLVAFAVAAPVAYLLMQRWLEGFAYRIGLGLGVFVLAGALALAVALLAVSYHAVRAARADPVESLALRIAGRLRHKDARMDYARLTHSGAEAIG